MIISDEQLTAIRERFNRLDMLNDAENPDDDPKLFSNALHIRAWACAWDVEPLLAEVKRLRLAHTTVSVALGESGRYSRWAEVELERRRGELAEALNQAIYWKGRWEFQCDQRDKDLMFGLKQDARIRKLDAQRDKVLALHTEDEGRCTECVMWSDGPDDTAHGDGESGSSNVEWPCPTVAIYADSTSDTDVAPTNSQTWEQGCSNVSYYGRHCILPPHSWRQPCHFAFDPDEGYDLINGTTLRDLLEALSAGGRIAISAAMRWIEYRLHRDATDAQRDIGGIVAQVCEGAERAAQGEQEILFRYLDMAPNHERAPTAIPAEDDAPYEQADDELADIERRVAVNRALKDAAKAYAAAYRASTVRPLPPDEEVLAISEQLTTARFRILAAVDAHNALNKPSTAAHRCPDCDQPTVYQSFSGGREWYCKPCDNHGSYGTGEAPRRLQMLADGRWDDLRSEMRQEIDRRHTTPSVVDGQPDTREETDHG